MPDISVTVLSDDLKLEGVLHLPGGPGPFPGVVVCHPHPQMGGSMRNNIVAAVCRGLQNERVAALRFNFRGVGESEGVSQAGAAEVQDAANALEHLRGLREIIPTRLGILGYSFGASIALQVASQEPALQAIGVIACPVQSLNVAAFHGLPAPKLLVTGEMDQAAPIELFRDLAPRFVEPRQVYTIAGGDHFLRGHEQEIGQTVGTFFHQWLT